MMVRFFKRRVSCVFPSCSTATGDTSVGNGQLFGVSRQGEVELVLEDGSANVAANKNKTGGLDVQAGET